MKNVVVVAPHPDDETLGCGGTLLRHKEQGDAVHWIIVTEMLEEHGFSPERIAARDREIQEVAERYAFQSVVRLGFPTTKLDEIPMSELVGKMSEAFQNIRPNILYVPYRGDVHTDHQYVFDAAVSCSKWFRYPYVEKILVYETLSETDFGMDPDTNGFRPNVYVDISRFLDQKLKIMQVYQSEIGEFPFPRSMETIRALASIRGSSGGFAASEAFMLLKERM
jgi:LmbE family N-acetylglucosaminyl deacetylase